MKGWLLEGILRQLTWQRWRRVAQVLPPMLIVLFAIVVYQSPRNDVWAEAPPPPTPDPLGSVQILLSQIDEAMRNIERELSRIEKTKQIEDDGETLELNMDKAAGAATQVFQVLELAATKLNFKRERGKEHSTARDQPDSLESTNFPDAVIAFDQSKLEFAPRIDEIQSRIADIQLGVLEGSILLSVELFKNMSAEERADFLKSLSPEAREIYKKLHPTRFSGFDIKLAQLSLSIQSAVRIGLDMCVPEAEAALASGCAGVCASAVATAGAVTPACVACWVAAGGTAYVLTDLVFSRDACKRTCGGCSWRRPWRCLCQAGCYASYMYALY